MTDAHKWVLTDEGLAEIINAENTGTAPVKLAFVGFGSGAYEANSSQTALQSEIKRVEASGGGNAGSNVIHITALDSSSDEYDVYEIGVFTESGVLFCVYSQTTPLMKKTAGSYLLVASDIVASSFKAESVTVGDTNFMNPPATEQMAGVVFLATIEETIAGTDQLKAVTPAGVQAFYDDIDGDLMHRASNESVTGQKFIYAPFSVYAKLLHSPAGSRQCILAMARDYVSGNVPANETIAGDATRGFRVLDKNSGTLGYFMSGVETNGVTSSYMAARNTFLNGALNTDGEEKTAEIKVGLDSAGEPFFTARDAGYDGDFVPYQNGSFLLGSEEKKWMAVYAGSFIGSVTGDVVGNATSATYDVNNQTLVSYVRSVSKNRTAIDGVMRTYLNFVHGTGATNTIYLDDLVLSILRGASGGSGYGIGCIRLVTMKDYPESIDSYDMSTGAIPRGTIVAGSDLREIRLCVSTDTSAVSDLGRQGTDNTFAGSWELLGPMCYPNLQNGSTLIETGQYGVALAIRVA